MTLVERLGFKTLNELYAVLDNNDIMEWAAYDRTQNPDWREAALQEQDLEQQKTQTAEEEAERMIKLFQGLGK